MSGNPNKLFLFCNELKRRKVTRVITVYAAAAFVILELVSIIVEPLKLPEWTLALVIVLLCAGLIVATILSWIFDIHPEEGIVKTKAVPEGKTGETAEGSNAWKISTYISIVVIIGLIVFNIWVGKRGARINESVVKSIAVLPFHNFSGDQDQDPMCLGLTDEIISNLYRVKSFDEVRPLSSVLTYRNSEKSATEIAATLHVNYILEGSYKRVGDELRITAKLTDSKLDNHIWLQDYDLPYREVIGIPAEIALQIADHLKAYISKDEKQSINRIPSENLEAYELMQKAIYLFNTVFLNAAEEITGLCEEVIRLDPSYADAYATKGLLILTDGSYFGGKELNSVAWEAETYFEKAIRLDNRNVRALTGISAIDHLVRWDYIKAQEGYMQALEYKRGEPMLNGWLVLFLIQMNRLSDALEILDKSGLSWSEAQIKIHFLSGDHRKAYEQIQEAPVFQSYYVDEITPYTELHIWMEDYNSAIKLSESAIQSKDPYIMQPRFQANLAVAYHKTGDLAQAEAIVNRLIQKSETSSVGSPGYFLGTYYSWIGEPDSAIYWLEKAFENRSVELPWLKVDPAFNSLKDDPRYWELYERTGHKAYEDFIASRNN